MKKQQMTSMSKRKMSRVKGAESRESSQFRKCHGENENHKN